MPYKSSLELSELQMKVLSELELLTDAFTSTFNEIGKAINAYSEEISVVIDKFTEKKTNWRQYDSQCFDLSYNPFRVEYSFERKFEIDSLNQFFNVGGRKTLIREIVIENKKREVDDLVFEWGFTYDIEDEKGITKYFYFGLWKKKKSEGAIFSKSEYENFAKKIKELCGVTEEKIYNLDHPDDNKSEDFRIWLDIKYMDKFSDFFQICKDELLEKFLLKIKD